MASRHRDYSSCHGKCAAYCAGDASASHSLRLRQRLLHVVGEPGLGEAGLFTLDREEFGEHLAPYG